jgi:hypothetical protein
MGKWTAVLVAGVAGHAFAVGQVADASHTSDNAPLRQINSVAELLSLTNEEAGSGYPVHLRAVVTLNSPLRYISFIQDGVLGMYAINNPDKQSGHTASGCGRGPC